MHKNWQITLLPTNKLTYFGARKKKKHWSENKILNTVNTLQTQKSGYLENNNQQINFFL